MKAMILAAGRGTRMKDLTKDVPKPMLPVAGKPVLERIMEGLSTHARVKSFFLLVGYREDVIRDYFGDGSSRGWEITYATQTTQDGTGRAVAYSRDWVGGDRFFLAYGDILISPPEYATCLQQFDLDGLVAVKKAPESELAKGGAVSVDGDFIFKRVVEKARPEELRSSWYNAGFYGFTPAVFSFIDKLEKSPRGEYELTDALNGMAGAGLKLRCCELKEPWADVRDPEVLDSLNASSQWV